MERVYLVCDSTEDCPNVGMEHLWLCSGRILKENGEQIVSLTSSSFERLRADIKRYLDSPENYEIVDLIGEPVPERFRENRIPFPELPEWLKELWDISPRLARQAEADIMSLRNALKPFAALDELCSLAETGMFPRTEEIYTLITREHLREASRVLSGGK